MKATRQSEAPSLGLVGDIGGTHCRFAITSLGQNDLGAPAKYPCADFPDIVHAIGAYLSHERRKIEWAMIAVAGPAENDEVSLTNLSWHISGREIAQKFGLREARLANDFTAISRATPLLEGANLVQVGGPARPDPSAKVVATIGAGTGLGVGGLVTTGAAPFPLSTEGGHTAFAPVEEFDFELLRVLRTRFQRVSNERLLSGEGLHNIYWAISVLEDAAPEKLEPKEITRRAIAKSDPRCVRAVKVFCRVLGAVAGDVALTLGARGGCFVSGGVIHGVMDVFDRAGFREAFESKGRFRPYMEAIPTWLVTHPYATLLGCAALAGDVIAPARAGVSAKV
ncbi:MAG TPA: glucokinase [Caulobacterales bacterium]|nr:glucokinase [Caulobacterales bacterium]